jgi:hypothetical protein
MPGGSMAGMPSLGGRPPGGAPGGGARPGMPPGGGARPGAPMAAGPRPGMPPGGGARPPGMPPGGRPGMPPPPGYNNGWNNFLGVTAGVVAGGVILDAVTTPTYVESPVYVEPTYVETVRRVETSNATAPDVVGEGTAAATQRVAPPALAPEQRAGWAERAAGRNPQWQQRVDNRNESWNSWQTRNKAGVTAFQNTRLQQWNGIQTARANSRDWRIQNLPEWQKHRQQLWAYRAGRATEVWYHSRDYWDHLFDDRWWGYASWGYGPAFSYPVNPWWWWAPADWTAISGYVESMPPDPYYIDYGGEVIYEGDTVYVDNLAIPAADYTQSALQLAATAEQARPPLPPQDGKPAEWLPLGAFALAQEDKGEPILIFQLSVNRQGLICGAYQSTLQEDQRPVAGQVDKATQRVAWRIGENRDTVFATSLANLTRDVSTVAIHFGQNPPQTWLLIRMPEPGSATKAAKLPQISSAPPPARNAKGQ